MSDRFVVHLEVHLLADSEREAEAFARAMAQRIKAGYTSSYVPVWDAEVQGVEPLG